MDVTIRLRALLEQDRYVCIRGQSDLLAFNAGNHHELVRMGWSDYERLVHPRIMSMTRH